MHARKAGERTAFTMHFFRSGGALTTRALAREDLPTVMQSAFWKKPSTARRYLRLMEVLIPGSVGNSMVTGVSPELFREINELGLSGRHSGTRPWHDHQLEREYEGAQSPNTNKKGLNIRANHQLYSIKWAR